MQLVSDLEPYNMLKLASKIRHKPSGRTFLLRRLTDSSNKGSLYFWCKDSEEQHFEVNPDDWEHIVPNNLDPQTALKRLLDCIHDGERIEILQAMDELHDHIRHMGELPQISKDYSDNHHSLWVLNVEINDISS